jgi:hypothetical protein
LKSRQIGEIREKNVRLMGPKVLHFEPARRDGDYPASVGMGAIDVGGRIADDHRLVRVDRSSEHGDRPIDGDRRKAASSIGLRSPNSKSEEIWI